MVVGLIHSLIIRTGHHVRATSVEAINNCHMHPSGAFPGVCERVVFRTIHLHYRGSLPAYVANAFRLHAIIRTATQRGEE